MASIRKRGSKYQARVVRAGHPTLAKTFISRADAVRWARNTEVSIERGEINPQLEGTTLRRLVERYLREETPRKKNVRQETSNLRQWMREDFAGKPAAKLKPSQLAEWRDARITAGTAPGTVRNMLAALSVVYRHARLEWGYESLINPVERIRRPVPGRSRTRRVSPAEIQAICKATESVELPPIVTLAVETGMRLSEIVGLRWRDVSLDSRTVALSDSKNGDSREVPLSSTVVATLQDWKKRTAVVSITGRVFQITPHAVSVAFRRATRRARKVYDAEYVRTVENSDPSFLLGLRFHDLRHEAVSRLFERGFNVMEVAAISGQRTLQMLKRYTHLKAEDLARRMG